MVAAGMALKHGRREPQQPTALAYLRSIFAHPFATKPVVLRTAHNRRQCQGQSDRAYPLAEVPPLPGGRLNGVFGCEDQQCKHPPRYGRSGRLICLTNTIISCLTWTGSATQIDRMCEGTVRILLGRPKPRIW